MPGDMRILEQAKVLEGLGYSVFPLAPGSKRPDCAWKPYQSQRATVEELVRLFSRPQNLGVVTGRVSGGIIGVDLDSAEAKRLAASKLPPTPMMVSTPSGGEHWYYRSSAKVRNGVKLLGTDLDVRGEGGYLVAPPSRLLGRSYEWQGAILPSSELPELDPALLPRSGDIARKGDASAAEKYIAHIRSIQGQGGDAALFKAACALIQKFELPYDVALSILQRWNVTNAQPTWRDDRLSYKLNEAVRLHGGRVDRLRLQFKGEIGMVSVTKSGVDSCILCRDKTPKRGVYVQFTDESLKGFCCTSHFMRAVEARQPESTDDRDSQRPERPV